MSANMPPSSLSLEAQLLSIMDVLVKAAVAEISQLFSESSSSLRLQLSQSLRENETLRMRMKVMRSELFSLRERRGNITKPRSKSQVLSKPPVAQTTVSEATSKTKSVCSAAQVQRAGVHSPDVIVISVEDDAEGRVPVVGQDDFGNHNMHSSVSSGFVSAGSSCLTGDNGAEGLRIVGVYGRGEGPLQKDSNTLSSVSGLQALNCLSDNKRTHGGLCANDKAPITVRQDDSDKPAGNSQLERRHTNQMVSAVKPSPAADDAQPSHTSQFSQQQDVFPHSVNKPLDSKLLVSDGPAIEAPLPCSFCGMLLASRKTLRIHMRLHTGDKPYTCEQCGKRFAHSRSLKIHQRNHSGEKPFTCSQCPASFSDSSNLRRHVMAHINDGLKKKKHISSV